MNIIALVDPRLSPNLSDRVSGHYAVLLGGETSELKDRLPQAVNLNTWPATFFIGRDGLVRGAHAGFASKATGEEHERLKAEFQHKIESLLAENLKSSR